MRVVAENILTALDANLVVPFLVDPGNAHLNGIGAVTRSEPGVDIEPLEIFHKVAIGLTDERSIAVTAFREKKSIIAEDVREDPHAKQWLARLTGTRSAIAVPIMRDQESVGVIVVGDSHLRRFTGKEVETVSELTDKLDEEWFEK